MVGNYINMIVNNTLIKNEKVEELFNNLSNQEFEIIEAAHLATHNNNSDRENVSIEDILSVLEHMISATPELINKLNKIIE